MDEKQIKITLETSDGEGNTIQAGEIKTFLKSEKMDVQNYIELFVSILRKHEYSPDQIQKGMHEYFIETDKKDFPG